MSQPLPFIIKRLSRVALIWVKSSSNLEEQTRKGNASAFG